MNQAPPQPPDAGDASWARIARGIEAEADLRAAFTANGADLRRPAVELLAHLQALRERLAALRQAADGAAKLAPGNNEKGRRP